MTIQELCKSIELQDSVVVRVNEFIASYDFAPINNIMNELTTPQTAEAAYKKLTEVFTDDEDQIKMLSCQLICAVNLYDNFQEKGISDQIYVDTMKCFTRFIGECKVKTGKYAFDRAWWTYRQVSMVLFRIGELEYELTETNGTKTVALHIPSDARFTPENVDESIRIAKELLNKCYPEYAECDFTCESWLLAPKLKELLGENSNIISFQNRFDIVKQNIEAKDIFEWLFKTFPDCELSELREETFLQRKVKELLFKGENVGIAFGVLKR